MTPLDWLAGLSAMRGQQLGPLVTMRALMALWQNVLSFPLPSVPPRFLFTHSLERIYCWGESIGVKEGSGKEKAFRCVTAAGFAASSM